MKRKIMKLSNYAVLVLSSLLIVSGSTIASPSKNKTNDPDRLSLEDAPKGFQGLIQRLRQAVNDKKASVINSALSKDFYIERDFGGVYSPDVSPAENFSYCYQLDNSKMFPEYKDTGWNALEKVLNKPLFERVDAEICTPYGAREMKPYPHEQLCFVKSNQGEWRISGFVNGGD